MAGYESVVPVLVWVDPWAGSVIGSGWAVEFRGSRLFEFCVGRLASFFGPRLVVVTPRSNSANLGVGLGEQAVSVCYVASGRVPKGLGEAAELLRARRVLAIHGLFGLELVPLNSWSSTA